MERRRLATSVAAVAVPRRFPRLLRHLTQMLCAFIQPRDVGFQRVENRVHFSRELEQVELYILITGRRLPLRVYRVADLETVDVVEKPAELLAGPQAVDAEIELQAESLKRPLQLRKKLSERVIAREYARVDPRFSVRERQDRLRRHEHAF